MLDQIRILIGSINWLPWVVGIVIGLGAILIIRAQQSWRYRQSYGYDVYTADSIRRRLGRWGVVLAVAGAAAGAVFIWQIGAQGGISTILKSSDPTNPLQDMKLVIPRLGLETPVIAAKIIAGQWDISLLTSEVAHLEGTAYPGEKGNAALAGHVTIPGAGWGPFQELNSLQPGDLVYIEQGERTITYQVVEIKIVESTDVQVVYPTDDYRLTLMTCTGWDGTIEKYVQRLVAIARMLPPTSQ